MIKKALIACTSIVFLLTACNFPLFGPTIDQNAVKTSVAETLAAAGGVVIPPGVEEATNTTGPGVIVEDPTITNTIEPTITLTPTQTTTPIPCNRATYVDDVTIEDGTEILPNTTFTKTWRIRNVGSCSWTSGYSLVFDHGDQMGGPASVQLTSVSIPPGGEVDVSVELKSPAAEGEYKGYWKFREPGGTIFALTTGNPVSVEIVSKAGAAIFPLIPLIPLIPLVFNPYSDMVWKQVNIPAGGVGDAIATCPEGTIVVGGGFAAGNDIIVKTTLMNGNGWQTYGSNKSASSQLLNSYAVCLHFSSGTVAQVFTQTSVNAGDIGHAVVSCPAGSIPTGGGWASNDKFWVYHSTATANGWEVYAKNTDAASKLLNVYAVCLSGSGGSVQEIATNVNIGAGASLGQTAYCPADSIVTGGGFALQDDLVIYNITMHNSSTGWNAYARNSGAGSRLMNVYATCLTIP